MITRRGLGAGLIGAVGLAGRALAVEQDLGAIERLHGRRLGAFAVDTGSGRTLAYRADERFLMNSSFKALLAGCVLSRVDAGQESLARTVRYGAGDMLPNSPVTQAHLAVGAMSVGALCEAVVEVSDNASSTLLMRSVGGPAELTRFYRKLGDDVTRTDRYELASGVWNGTEDTTTPRAVVGLVRRLLLGDALTPSSRAMLEGWMVASKPGLHRLRASMPAGWRVGDKTGTGGTQLCDYAIVRPPGRAPLLVSAFYESPTVDFDGQEAVLREVGAAFVRWAG